MYPVWCSKKNKSKGSLDFFGNKPRYHGKLFHIYTFHIERSWKFTSLSQAFCWWLFCDHQPIPCCADVFVGDELFGDELSRIHSFLLQSPHITHLFFRSPVSTTHELLLLWLLLCSLLGYEAFSSFNTHIHLFMVVSHRTQVVGSYECLHNCTFLVYVLFINWSSSNKQYTQWMCT